MAGQSSITGRLTPYVLCFMALVYAALAYLLFLIMGATLLFAAVLGGILLFMLSLSFNIISGLASLIGGRDTGTPERARSLNPEKRAKHIVFATPSADDQPFYTKMLMSLVKSAFLRSGSGASKYILIPYIPSENFDSYSLWTQIQGISADTNIDGVIFIPDNPDKLENRSALVRFPEVAKVPLVLIDVDFDPQIRQEQLGYGGVPRLPYFVGGDERAGGNAAAQVLLETFPLRPNNPRVLVVNGADTPWEKQRAAAFKEALQRSWPDVRFHDTRHINYSRDEARTEAHKELVGLANDKTIPLTAIFSCNDDMAIGCRSVLRQLLFEGYSFETQLIDGAFVDAYEPKIVGYDGIREMRDYIEAGDRFIAGTVDVNIEMQARGAMALIADLIEGRAPDLPSRQKLIQPIPIHNRQATVRGTS